MSPSPETAHAIRETPAASVPGPPSPPSQLPDREVVLLPRPAQWTAGTLLAGLLLYLVTQNVVRWVESFEPVSLPRLQLDLNRASRAQLVQLPGVGPALSERIAAYREAHGPFKSLNDLRRVPGIGPAMMGKVRPHLYIGTESDARNEAPTEVSSRVSYYAAPKIAVSKAETTKWTGPPLDINQASAAELDKLPGIGPKLAQRIVEFRAAKPFTTIDDLRKVSGIGPKTLEKIRPYVAVQAISKEDASIK